LSLLRNVRGVSARCRDDKAIAPALIEVDGVFGGRGLMSATAGV
jgi:hypothetical protein